MVVPPAKGACNRCRVRHQRLTSSIIRKAARRPQERAQAWSPWGE
jgi:hypothetical protein